MNAYIDDTAKYGDSGAKSVAVALLATIALWIVLLTRAPGINQQRTALSQACIAWVFTRIAALILVKNGAFHWLPARYAVVIVLHLAGGEVGLMGLSEWWILPCVAFATVVPLLVQSAALNASFPPVLLVVIALPAGYCVRVKMKERELAAHNANWSDALHERGNHIPSTATVDSYFPFVVEPRHQGIAEHAARLLARREGHEAMLVEALHGPNRYEALCLLAIDGVPPAPAQGLARSNTATANAKWLLKWPFVFNPTPRRCSPQCRN